MIDTEGLAAFLRTCTASELVALQHDARAKKDDDTLRAVLAEFKRRAKLTGGGDA